MIALARSPVGIDLEAVDRAEAALLHRLHPNEKVAILRLPSTHRSRALIECWVRKEAYLKGYGTGIAAGHLQTTDIGPGPQFGHGTDALTGWSLTSLMAPPGYAAAAALSTSGPLGCAQGSITYHGCDQCQRPTPAAAVGAAH
ncbi:4'-phosphopantetheinyl transferase family protein [Streptomyces iakyrus]